MTRVEGACGPPPVICVCCQVPFEMVWVGTVFNEVAAFVFYGVTGYLFRPQSLNPYMQLRYKHGGAP